MKTISPMTVAYEQLPLEEHDGLEVPDLLEGWY